MSNVCYKKNTFDSSWFCQQFFGQFPLELYGCSSRHRFATTYMQSQGNIGFRCKWNFQHFESFECTLGQWMSPLGDLSLNSSEKKNSAKIQFFEQKLQLEQMHECKEICRNFCLGSFRLASFSVKSYTDGPSYWRIKVNEQGLGKSKDSTNFFTRNNDLDGPKVSKNHQSVKMGCRLTESV